MNRIFLYNITGEKLETVRRTALWLGLTPVVVAPGDFSLPLGALLGEEGYDVNETEEAFEDEMLVMETLSAPLLDALRRARVLIPLKAVVTEQNKAWSAPALCRELRREHEAMRAQSVIKRSHPRRK